MSRRCITINCKCCGEEISNAITVPMIGENQNWWIGDQDTGIAVQGPAGADGAKGEKGDAGVLGPAGPQGPAGSFAEIRRWQSRFRRIIRKILEMSRDRERQLYRLSIPSPLKFAMNIFCWQMLTRSAILTRDCGLVSISRMPIA